MKNIQAIFYLATMIGGVLSVASCNNENETITASKTSAIGDTDRQRTDYS